MFAIAFDIRVAETKMRHPKGVTAAYLDISTTLERYFRGIQGSVYVYAFRIEQWSDFNPMMKMP